MTDSVTLYHNPRCSKSRQALALLREAGIEPQIVEYLKLPLDFTSIDRLLVALDRDPREVMRKGEAPYKTLDLGRDELTRKQLIEAIVAHPILLERPIAVHQGRAVIGRPPENVMELLQS